MESQERSLLNLGSFLVQKKSICRIRGWKATLDLCARRRRMDGCPFWRHSVLILKKSIARVAPAARTSTLVHYDQLETNLVRRGHALEERTSRVPVWTIATVAAENETRERWIQARERAKFIKHLNFSLLNIVSHCSCPPRSVAEVYCHLFQLP